MVPGLEDMVVTVLAYRTGSSRGGDLMKSQARLRLRQPGRHHRIYDGRPWPRWVYLLGVHATLVQAFQMNCHPKHYDTGIETPTYTMDYITGKTTWHGPPPYTPHVFTDLALTIWNGNRKAHTMNTIRLGGAGGQGPGEPGKPGHSARIENGRLTIEPCGETDCDTCNPTESETP